MTSVAVAGLTTADIHAARDVAGPNGTVFFPAGTYDGNVVIADKANQTWKFEQGAVLLRSPTAAGDLITLRAPLKIRGGVIDGNRANNSSVGFAIVGAVDGCDLDMDGVTVQNTTSWGVGADNATLKMCDCIIKDTKFACLIQRVSQVATHIAPQIFNCVFDRRNENPATIQSSCVLIQTTNAIGAQYMLRPRIENCDFLMPYSLGADVVGMELLNCQRGWVKGCYFEGGRIGLSIANSGFMNVEGNNFLRWGDYAIELGGNDLTVIGNSGSGSGPSRDGISVNPACSGTLKVHTNTFNGCWRAAVFDPSSRITAQWAN